MIILYSSKSSLYANFTMFYEGETQNSFSSIQEAKTYLDKVGHQLIGIFDTNTKYFYRKRNGIFRETTTSKEKAIDLIRDLCTQFNLITVNSNWDFISEEVVTILK